MRNVAAVNSGGRFTKYYFRSLFHNKFSEGYKVMSIEEIRKKYNISSSDLEEIKAQLKIKIKENHPDNNNNFDSDYFSQLSSDLAYVENLIENPGYQNTLVPVNEVLQTLVEVLQVPAKRDKNPKEVLNEELSENIQNRLLRTKKHLMVPRIGSTTIAVIITFLWMFPDKVMKHPLIQAVFGNTEYATMKFAMNITIVWLFTLLIVGLIWLKCIYRERREKNLMENIKLESVQNEIFMDFLSCISPQNQFSKLDFMNNINSKICKGKIYQFRLEEKIIQNVADIILLRAKEYGVIKTIKSHSLIDCYEIIQDGIEP